jgi:tetratricopeptide (TPR) repeat protein
MFERLPSFGTPFAFLGPMVRLLLLTLLLITAESVALAYRQPPSAQEMTYLDQQIAAQPNNSRLLQMRGLNYAVLGQKDNAIADFKAAQKITPKQVRLYWTLGWALFNLDDPASAMKVWEQAAALADQKKNADPASYATDPDDLPDASWIPCTLAFGYWANGDEAKAIELFDLEAKVNVHYRDHDLFKQETNGWTEKEQTTAMLLFDAWKKRADEQGSHH